MKLEEQEKKVGLFSRILQTKQKVTAESVDDVSTTTDAMPFEATPVDSTTFAEVSEAKWSTIQPKFEWSGKHRLVIQVNKDATQARLFLNAPIPDEPEDCTLDIVQQVLASCRITYGIDHEALKTFFESAPSLPYNTYVTVAHGIPSIEGIDGYVKELYERTSKPHLDERPDGTIDFKNLHIVNNVSKGTVICEVHNPVQGTTGTSVYNQPLRPRVAKAPSVPRGEGIDLVVVDDTLTHLVAAIDGNLVYKNQRFSVEHTYRVNGNVNNSVGNINFTGNVIVTGDVCEGYSIKTDGDVTVYGIVEGASIHAGGSIYLQKGINGMGKGFLEAQKGITAKFIENCTVRAGGDIKSESIINSTVETDGNLTLAGRGTLIGGNITAFGSVDAKIIGSRSNTPINIVLGVTPNMLREHVQVRQQHKEVLSEFQAINSDILYLEQAQNIAEDNRQKLLEQYRGKLNLVLFKKSRLEKKLLKFDEQKVMALSCTLTCTTAFPPLRLTIGKEVFRLTNAANMCRFYQSSTGEIVLGAK